MPTHIPYISVITHALEYIGGYYRWRIYISK